MAYSLYMDGVLFPVPPSKVRTKIKNQNDTVTLINDGEINFLKEAGLTEIEFDLLLPQVEYPFASYPDGFRNAGYYLEKLEELKVSKKSFRFILSRTTPQGDLLFDTNMEVSIEDYDFSDDTKEGFDITASVTLKQYRNYGVKTVKIVQQKKVIAKESRPDPERKARTHTVVAGDCLWNIARDYLGDGRRYPEIYEANKEQIDSWNAGTGNPRYTIYPRQVFVIP